MSTTAEKALAALADTQTLLLSGVQLPAQPGRQAPAAAAAAPDGPTEPIYDRRAAAVAVTELRHVTSPRVRIVQE